MDQYLIYFAPYLVIGLSLLLGPFASDSWPDWLGDYLFFCAKMANGMWVAGIAMLLMANIGVPISIAAISSLPVMYFSGRYLVRWVEKYEEVDAELKRQAWEEYEKADDQ